nr:putative wax ester synthase/acyl-CoA:diacylglycerol acyltransferase [uncultured bacterium]
MAVSYYERLSALDASFLGLEVPNARWHEAAVLIFDRAPLCTDDGGIDVDKITRLYECFFPRVERYRQKLGKIPLLNHPIWIDDPAFNIRYHIRHIALPKPGSERILKRVCGYILSQPLDLTKPLWEVWIVDGLDKDRFALVTKAHHCMVDGVSGMDMLANLLKPYPSDLTEQSRPWLPRKAPVGVTLLKDELQRRMRAPYQLLKPLRHPRRAWKSARDVAQGIAEASRLGWNAASQTPFNPKEIGPHRRFDWSEIPLADIKDVKETLLGTVNDVVLATAAGALGRFLRAHHTSTRDIDFRALIPVSVRTGEEENKLGNRVAMMMARLPVDETDPVERLRLVADTMNELKGSKQAIGVRWLEEFSDLVAGRLFLELSKSATRTRPFNVAVTNVRGPQFPLYLLGARMHALYPMMPLFSNQALGMAVLSYNDKVFWGFNSDWDWLPDLHDVVEAVDRDFYELHRAALQSKPSAHVEIHA